MTGLAVFLLTAAACLLLLPRPGSRSAEVRRGSGRASAGSRTRRRSDAAELDQLPLFVRQLAALLSSGRTPAQLWPDMLSVYAAAGQPDRSTPGARRRDGTEPAPGAAAREAGLLLPTLEAAAQAADLGLGIGPVLRRQGPGNGRRVRPEAAAVQRMWHDLASCWEVSERTGAPLSLLLENYARHLQHRLDARAARRTALAGPKATAALLGWLPLLGLGLGAAMGADPVATLLLSPTGWPVLVTGAALMVGARLWSRQLVRHAAGREGL